MEEDKLPIYKFKCSCSVSLQYQGIVSIGTLAGVLSWLNGLG